MRFIMKDAVKRSTWWVFKTWKRSCEIWFLQQKKMLKLYKVRLCKQVKIFLVSRDTLKQCSKREIRSLKMRSEVALWNSSITWMNSIHKCVIRIKQVTQKFRSWHGIYIKTSSVRKCHRLNLCLQGRKEILIGDRWLNWW